VALEQEEAAAAQVLSRGNPSAASRLRWVVRFVLAFTFLAGLAFLLSDAPARWLVLDDPLPKAADAVLVMAGDPGYERTATATRLLLEGRARLLILTGGEPGPGDSASSLRAWAVHKGVPEARIRMEAVSQGTHSSMMAVRPLLEAEGVRTLVLVTSPYHHRRAFQTASRAFGPRVRIFNHPARPSAWVPRDWWKTSFSRRIVVSEHLKLAYYTLRGWL
jgi:uncharacterized SAM-binding protein YcdF (DUF218 family)